MENLDLLKPIGFLVALLVLLYMLFIKYRPEQELDEVEVVENSDELILDIYYLGKYCVDMKITIEDLQKINNTTSKKVEE